MSWSIGGKILDIYDDPNLGLLAASPFFEKVGSLSMGDPDALVNLEDRQFGVVFLTKKGEAIRKYPLNDFTNAVLSNVYFEMTHDRLPPEAKVAAATQIKDASAVFGFEAVPAVMKYASEESLEGRNYVRLDKIAQRSGSPVNIVAQLQEDYVANRELYSRQDRIELAEAMGKASEKFAFEIPADLKPFLVKDAEINKEALMGQCHQRKQLLQDRPEATHLMDEFLAKHAQFEPRETVKLLETFDREFNLERYWGRGLEPNLILQEKVAYHDMPVACGPSQFSTEETKAWVGSNGDLLKKMFGKELAAKISSDPGAIWSLPEASRRFLTARMEHARDNSPTETD